MATVTRILEVLSCGGGPGHHHSFSPRELNAIGILRTHAIELALSVLSDAVDEKDAAADARIERRRAKYIELRSSGMSDEDATREARVMAFL